MSCLKAPYFTLANAYTSSILLLHLQTNAHEQPHTPPAGYSIHFPYPLETQHKVIKPAAIHQLNGTL